MQHSLRSFSVPLRPAAAAAAATIPNTATANATTTDPPNNTAEVLPPATVRSGQGGPSAGVGVVVGGGGGVGGTPTNITVPANLPANAAEVVERATRSLRAFKEACSVLLLLLTTAWLYFLVADVCVLDV